MIDEYCAHPGCREKGIDMQWVRQGKRNPRFICLIHCEDHAFGVTQTGPAREVAPKLLMVRYDAKAAA